MSTSIQVTTVDRLVEAVDEHLPFPTELYADMGSDNWALQIYFGPHRASDELPVHRAGIDPEISAPTWWVEFDRGERIAISELGATAPVEDVAAWINAQRQIALGQPCSR